MTTFATGTSTMMNSHSTDGQRLIKREPGPHSLQQGSNARGGILYAFFLMKVIYGYKHYASMCNMGCRMWNVETTVECWTVDKLRSPVNRTPPPGNVIGRQIFLAIQSFKFPKV